MAFNLAERIEKLSAAIQPISADDAMPEAGRKILLAEFVKVLEHEAGSRTGEDIEDVHDMRVATRRIRSLFRLLTPFYKKRAISGIKTELQHLAWTLGTVRDLDVLIEDIQAFQGSLDPERQSGMIPAIDVLDQQRRAARLELVSLLDSHLYRRLIKDFSKFLTTPGEGAKSIPDDEVLPIKVRHILPIIIYHRVAAVRAFDSVLADADAVTLHALRIEFKRLRYTLSLFGDVLGAQASDYIGEVKGLQDCLGHMNDAVVARAFLGELVKIDQYEGLSAYVASLEAKEANLKAELTELWGKFNSRKTQQKLSAAILALH